MKLPEPLKSGWKSARLLIAFHRSRSGERHDEPRLWRPKDGSAALPTGPEKEVFVVVRGEGEAGDVQIRMQPDRIVLRRDEDAIGWTGIQADHHGVSVLVGDV